jgi:aryl hydrocarbon receptor
LDTGLSSSYFTEADQLLVTPNGSPTPLTGSSAVGNATPRTNRRYKTQLRDFLSTCRSKRKISQQNQPAPPTPTVGLPAAPAANVEVYPDPAAVAAAYSNLNHYAPSPYATSAADNLYMTAPVHSTNFYPAENLFHQYRLQGVSGYYPDYHHAAHHHHSHLNSPTYVSNGFLTYDGYALPTSVVGVTKEEKWHQDEAKYYGGDTRGSYNNYSSPTHQQSHVSINLSAKLPFD